MEMIAQLHTIISGLLHLLDHFIFTENQAVRTVEWVIRFYISAIQYIYLYRRF